MVRLTFITGEYYHIFNRGVEKRDIFIDDGDFLRFIHYLYVLNDDQPLSAEFRQRVDLTYEVRPRRLKRELLVDIFTFCLMPNHYHIFLRQRVDNGISKFMQKLGTAESMFFNAKYKHSGSIFQGKFKSVLVKGESQTIVLPNYQHLNPIDLIEPGWKENGIKNPRRAIEFLENYRWSSYLDYVGKKNFPSIINQEFLRGIIGGPEEFKGIIKGIIFDKAISNKFLKESKSLTID